ncbi:uncharacterized protein J8A68_001414 [[Candida] subhashii]|uniref:ribonuclease III n=1 Tax=[Candida] subhashii TaxID=561895 RepID=A0A8J5UZY2_9ASCO|nr:uncharacterized protein J8A68_001414 [[Candida] subhashii]KAG7665105.1 hypothetical protein J8A68_001414 [[Candida] subhashii]
MGRNRFTGGKKFKELGSKSADGLRNFVDKLISAGGDNYRPDRKEVDRYIPHKRAKLSPDASPSRTTFDDRFAESGSNQTNDTSYHTACQEQSVHAIDNEVVMNQSPQESSSSSSSNDDETVKSVHMTSTSPNPESILPQKRPASPETGETRDESATTSSLFSNVSDKSDSNEFPKIYAEPTFDKEIPNRIGFTDLQKLEYATKTLQRNVKVILEDAPDCVELKTLINSDKIDRAQKIELKTNELITMASKLKSRYKLGRLPILDEISNGNIHFKKEDLAELEEIAPIEQSNIEFNAPVNPITEEIAPTGVDNTLPELPEIKDIGLYERVFIHKSSVNNKAYLDSETLIRTHNERLEFLGDSVLNNLVTCILYEEFPAASEGRLSRFRSDLVNNRVLKEFAFDYGFDKKLRTKIDDLILKNGDQKIYADAFEAYVGALAIERGLDLAEVKQWLFDLYTPFLNKMRQTLVQERLNKEAKAQLYSVIGTADHHPQYKTIQTGDGIRVDFVVHCTMKDEVIGVGTAGNIKEAGLRAAMDALKNRNKLEKFYIERQEIERPLRKIRREKNELKKEERKKKIEEEVEMLKNAPPLPPTSPIRTGLFPIPVDEEAPLDHSAKNELYAEIGRKTGTQPKYIIRTVGGDHEVTLTIRNLPIATATDSSKKKAMARTAMALLNNKDAMREICKRFIAVNNEAKGIDEQMSSASPESSN